MGLLRILFARRTLLPSLLVVTVVSGAALHASPASSLADWAMAAVGVGLAIAGALSAGRLRWALLGAALASASLAGSGVAADPLAWVDAAGLVGGAIASWAAARAIAETPSTPGLLPGGSSSGHATAAMAALVWLGCAAAALRSLDGALGTFVASLSLASLVWLGGLGAWGRVTRGLELEAEARLGAVVAVGVMAAAAACALLVATRSTPSQVGRLVVPVACVAMTVVTSRGDALAVSKLVRRIAVLASLGAGVSFPLVLLAADAPRHAGVVVLVAVAASLALASAARGFERSLLPEKGALLDAMGKASRDIVHDEPDFAIRAALAALRSPDPSASRPELYLFAPARVAWVDTAGYLHERDGELPPELVPNAAKEPLGVLRTSVLAALEVRRPDLRPLLAWMRDSGALAAALVMREGDVEGVLMLPRGARSRGLTLEEAAALTALAGSLSMAMAAKAALARSAVRERESAMRADAEADRAARLEHALSLHTEHNARAADRLARPATVGIYSAASRLAFDATLRRAKSGAPVFVVAPSGVDPVPYLARAHLAGPRAEAPLVLVDGTSTREHELSRWKDPLVSPLALADRGTLVLLDGAALPADVQRLVGQALAERRVPWARSEPLDVVLALTSALDRAALLESGRLDPLLGDRLADALESPIELPRLRDRAEDLRAIVSDRLAREGMRVRGAPVGIDAAAFARLMEHPFAGEEAELASIVLRLVAACEGDVIRAADVDRIGLAAAENSGEAAARGEPKGPRAVR